MSNTKFNTDAWLRSDVTERVGHCQIMNNEALMLAENFGHNEAAAYRSLARAWMRLADVIGDEALIPTKNTERGNKLQPNNIPTPELVSSDFTMAPPDLMPVPEPMAADPIKGLSDNIPVPNRGGNDATAALLDKTPLPECSPSDITKAMPDKAASPAWRSRDAIEALHSAMQKFGEASGKQARIMVRLTYAIVFLTIAMLFSVLVQIWLDWPVGGDDDEPIPVEAVFPLH